MHILFTGMKLQDIALRVVDYSHLHSTRISLQAASAPNRIIPFSEMFTHLMLYRVSQLLWGI